MHVKVCVCEFVRDGVCMDVCVCVYVKVCGCKSVCASAENAKRLSNILCRNSKSYNFSFSPIVAYMAYHSGIKNELDSSLLMVMGLTLIMLISILICDLKLINFGFILVDREGET